MPSPETATHVSILDPAVPVEPSDWPSTVHATYCTCCGTAKTASPSSQTHERHLPEVTCTRACLWLSSYCRTPSMHVQSQSHRCAHRGGPACPPAACCPASGPCRQADENFPLFTFSCLLSVVCFQLFTKARAGTWYECTASNSVLSSFRSLGGAQRGGAKAHDERVHSIQEG
jgi:hypothetical protein